MRKLKIISVTNKLKEEFIRKLYNFKIRQSIMETGSEDKDMGLESKHGLMELNIRVSGLREKPKEKENFNTLMEMYTKENGKMIRPMVLEYIIMRQQEPNMKVFGKMTCSMVQVYKRMQMETVIKECLKKEKGMDKANIFSLMERYMMGNG